MEILKRHKAQHKFKVLKTYLEMGKQRVEVGTEIELPELEANDYVALRRVVPCDLEEVGVYIALRAFVLPGRESKFESKPGELVSLKAEDALRLMLDGSVLPRDDHRWRPNNRRLRSSPDNSAQKASERDKAAFEQLIYEQGLPSRRPK